MAKASKTIRQKQKLQRLKDKDLESYERARNHVQVW